MKHYKTRILILTFFVTIISAQTSYHGLTSWYSSDLVSMAGGYSPNSDEADRINPAYLGSLKQNRVVLALVNYPAGIRAKMVNATFLRSEKVWTISLRHLNYGTFEGADEDGILTGEYRSGDTWATVGRAMEIPRLHAVFGWNAGLFFSQLEQYESIVFTLTPGFVFQLPKLDAEVGLSLRNFGYPVKTYTDRKEPLPTEISGNVTKRLAHLPLEFNLGLNIETVNNTGAATLSGIFNLTSNIQLKVGVSSDKASQITQVNLRRDYIAGTGAGLSFKTQTVEISASGYAYGTGGWISGAGIKLYL